MAVGGARVLRRGGDGGVGGDVQLECGDGAFYREGAQGGAGCFAEGEGARAEEDVVRDGGEEEGFGRLVADALVGAWKG